MSGELEYHPYADVFPLTEGKEFDDLVNDIKKQGLISPIVLYQGKILDGRNRYRAMLQLGFPRKRILKHCTERGDIENALNFVIGANIRRRHLTTEQKRAALQALISANPQKSDRELAKDAGVSHPTVAKARAEGEATGKVLPVEARVGADKKTRKAPTAQQLVERAAKREEKRRAEFAKADAERQAFRALTEQLAADLHKAGLARRVLDALTAEDGLFWEDTLTGALERLLDETVGNDVDPVAAAEDRKAAFAKLETTVGAADVTPQTMVARDHGLDCGPMPDCLPRAAMDAAPTA